MKVIGLANPKGGVGKSVIAANLLVALTDRGYKTALIDAEKNSPLAKRLSKFDAELPVKAASTASEIAKSVSMLIEEGNLVIIDSPGDSGEELSALFLAADLVLIPMQTSEQDLLQSADALALVKSFQKRMGGVPQAHIILTGTHYGSIAARHFRKALVPFGIHIAELQIRQLENYKLNTSVMRNPALNTRGEATDIEALIDELIVPHLETQTTPLKGAANE